MKLEVYIAILIILEILVIRSLLIKYNRNITFKKVQLKKIISLINRLKDFPVGQILEVYEHNAKIPLFFIRKTQGNGEWGIEIMINKNNPKYSHLNNKFEEIEINKFKEYEFDNCFDVEFYFLGKDLLNASNFIKQKLNDLYKENFCFDFVFLNYKTQAENYK